MKLLIVDDEKDLLDQLRKMLTHQRYDVDTAEDGEAALDRLFENPYDLVVLDIMLPKTDGLTVLREMRAAGIQTPVIMLTAKGAVDDKVKGLDCGADDYLAKPFDLAELLKSVLREYEVVFSAKKIDIQADMPSNLHIKGDWDNLQLAIINLVDNAVKYNREGGEIRIKVAENKRGVHISLFNTGAGIPKTDLGRVFEQFYRVEKSRSTQYGGSGLGLSIVKRIIELHGGGIEIESEPSAWTRVNISFPYQDVMTKGVI